MALHDAVGAEEQLGCGLVVVGALHKAVVHEVVGAWETADVSQHERLPPSDVLRGYGLKSPSAFLCISLHIPPALQDTTCELVGCSTLPGYVWQALAGLKPTKPSKTVQFSLRQALHLRHRGRPGTCLEPRSLYAACGCFLASQRYPGHRGTLAPRWLAYHCPATLLFPCN